jgi:translation initiation factor 2B subunit (eIF-2B alpha/beta/delta family)
VLERNDPGRRGGTGNSGEAAQSAAASHHAEIMSPELQNRIARLAADRESGASEILQDALGILRDAREAQADIVDVARAVCLAQPSMAPMWNAAMAALAGRDRLAEFGQRVARAPDAIARFALDVFGRATGDRALRVVTISYSRTVLHTLLAVARQRPLQVACSEGRPALEGRTLARRLAASGVAVTFFSDAAIAHALEDAECVMTGADAVAPHFFLNKSGTRMLAAAATQQGVPCYVLASRDKFVRRDMITRLTMRDAAPAEIWPDPPAGVAIRNPYFEPTPLDWVTGVITDVGLLGTGAVPELCEANGSAINAQLLDVKRESSSDLH